MDLLNVRAKIEQEAKSTKIETNKKNQINAQLAADRAQVVLDAHSRTNVGEIKEFSKPELKELCNC